MNRLIENLTVEKREEIREEDRVTQEVDKEKLLKKQDYETN